MTQKWRRVIYRSGLIIYHPNNSLRLNGFVVNHLDFL